MQEYLHSIRKKYRKKLNQTTKIKKGTGKMIQFAGFEVLEVVSVREREDNATANGVKRKVKWATLKVASGEFSVQVGDGVEVPEGWEGKAVCDTRVISYVMSFKNSTPSTQYAFKPIIMTKFTATKKVERSDQYGEFFSSAPQKPVGTPTK